MIIESRQREAALRPSVTFVSGVVVFVVVVAAVAVVVAFAIAAASVIVALVAAAFVIVVVGAAFVVVVVAADFVDVTVVAAFAVGPGRHVCQGDQQSSSVLLPRPLWPLRHRNMEGKEKRGGCRISGGPMCLPKCPAPMIAESKKGMELCTGCPSFPLVGALS